LSWEYGWGATVEGLNSGGPTQRRTYVGISLLKTPFHLQTDAIDVEAEAPHLPALFSSHHLKKILL
jgi:hypothetical protein